MIWAHFGHRELGATQMVDIKGGRHVSRDYGDSLWSPCNQQVTENTLDGIAQIDSIDMPWAHFGHTENVAVSHFGKCPEFHNRFWLPEGSNPGYFESPNKFGRPVLGRVSPCLAAYSSKAIRCMVDFGTPLATAIFSSNSSSLSFSHMLT